MRKQVLILGHDYLPHFVDIFNQYTRLFDKQHYEVTLVYLTGEPNEDIKKRSLAEHVIFLNTPKKEIRGLKIGAIKTLLTLTREKKFDIAICHRYKPIYIMMWVAQFYKIPNLIFVLHELNTMQSLHRQLLIAGLARKNMLFAGVSNAVRDDLRNSLWGVNKKNIITLYNVIDVELTEPQLFTRKEARNILNLPADAFVFGNLARLAVNKDQTSLIHAFAAIKPHCPKAKLIILGKGDLEPQLRELVASYQLTNDIVFAGYIANGGRYMRAFDCFVLSSIQEAFGRVLIEAMLAKLPIIATRVHGIPEVVGDAGVIVAAKDVNGLATAMRNTYDLSSEARKKVGEKVYQHVNQHFSIPAFQKQFWSLGL